MYDSSGRYSGNSQSGVVGGSGNAQIGNYAAPPQAAAQGQPGQMGRHNNPGQVQYSSYNPNNPSVNSRSAGGYMNGAMDNPPPHAFIPAPPIAQQQASYDMGNNGAPYYNQRMPPHPQNNC